MMGPGSSAAARVEESTYGAASISTYEGVLRRALSLGIFPFTMLSFVGAGIYALHQGLPPDFLSPLFVPGFLAWVIALERLHPYCRDWNRDHGDLRADVVHFFVSGMATPLLVTALLNVVLVPLGGAFSARYHWFGWPSQWPILVQLALALVISEFGGYWAHRAQHTYPLLWRVHALHHGAPRLYWLNAVRFHPFDMIMLAGAGFGPLILLGCPKDTLAITLLFAGMHGTFQHANIHVKLGVLNWFFSMSELHRWHHSRSIEESNANYSGHVLIWDVLFGTRFLPNDRLPPADIGIAGMATFPNDYATQLKSPFILDELERDAAAQRARAAIPSAETR